MDPQKINALLAVLLSFIPFALVAGWLFYRQAKSGTPLFKSGGSPPKRIKVGDNIYVVKKNSRIVAIEKKTGQQVIVSTCGFEDGRERLEGELQELPEGVKVRYKLDNGIFSPEESDWLAGDDFEFSGIAQVEEYELE